MSRPTTGPSRRRRIAGERRTARPQAEQPASSAPSRGSTSGSTSVPSSAPEERTPRRGWGRRTAEPTERANRAERPEKAGPGEGTDRAAPRAAGWWGSPASLLTFGGVLAVLLVAAVLLTFGWVGNDSVAQVRTAEAVERASRSAPAAAERAAAAILAYDHESLEASKESAVAFMTDEFAEEYTTTFDRVVAPAARETEATVSAEVQASSVIRASEDRVRVLLFVDQTTESTANPAPQLALNRVEMVMVREDGSWVVEDIASY